MSEPVGRVPCAPARPVPRPQRVLRSAGQVGPAGLERLAAVGRLAANLAHEVRNPIAAMRLKAENALVSGDPDRAATALRAVLAQIARVDALLRDLLNLTQPRSLVRAPTPVAPLLAECAQFHEEFARTRGVAVVVAESPLPPDDHPHIDLLRTLRLERGKPRGQEPPTSAPPPRGESLCLRLRRPTNIRNSSEGGGR